MPNDDGQDHQWQFTMQGAAWQYKQGLAQSMPEVMLKHQAAIGSPWAKAGSIQTGIATALLFLSPKHKLFAS